MIPHQLSDIFSSFDEDDFDLNIIKVEHLGDKFIVNLLLQFRNDRQETVSQNWIIEASGHRRNRISFDFIPSNRLLLVKPGAQDEQDRTQAKQ